MIRIAMRPRWEDVAFAEGRVVLVLHADGTVQRATCAEELEPVEQGRMTRGELSRAAKILDSFPKGRT